MVTKFWPSLNSKSCKNKHFFFYFSMFARYYITWQLIFLPQSCIPLCQSFDRSRGLSSLIPLPQMKMWSWWHRARAQSCDMTLTFLTDVSALTAPSTHLDHSMVVHTERTQTVFTQSLFFFWNWQHFQWYYCWGLIKTNSLLLLLTSFLNCY